MSTMKKREELRTVSYWQDFPVKGYYPDEAFVGEVNPDTDSEDAKEKSGLFHTWAEVLEWDAQAGQHYVARVALIEDSQTGCLHEVSYKNFRFTDVCPGV